MSALGKEFDRHDASRAGRQLESLNSKLTGRGSLATSLGSVLAISAVQLTEREESRVSARLVLNEATHGAGRQLTGLLSRAHALRRRNV